MFVGFRPRWNVTSVANLTGSSAGRVSGNQYVWRDWHRLTKMVNAVQNTSLSLNFNAGRTTGTATTNDIGTRSAMRMYIYTYMYVATMYGTICTVPHAHGTMYHVHTCTVPWYVYHRTV